MSNVCRFTLPASRDIETIIDYIADNSSFDAADRLLAKINNTIQLSISSFSSFAFFASFAVR